MQIISDDLARSGITEKNIATMKLTYLTAKLTEDMTTIKKAHGYTLPYFSISGKPIPYSRVRLFSLKQDTLRKLTKYWQASGSVPRLYFYPGFKWTDIVDDKTPIVITEGEKKAAKGCIEGIPTIGLGGVWAFKSKKLMRTLLDDFLLLQWKGREVTIVYDSDIEDKEEVRAAQTALAKELTQLGAIVSLGSIPPDEGSKAGLDDYLLHHSVKDFWKLPRVLFSECEKLYALNEELSFIDDLNTFYHHRTKKLFDRASLASTMYANRFYVALESGKLRKKPIIKEWVEWEQRRTYSKLVYAPGEVSAVNNCLNVWPGWGVIPKRGSVKPFFRLIDFLVGDNKEFKEWFLNWIAHPLQHPGTKLYSSVVLWSLSTGVGKSFLGYILGDIYGENFSAVGQGELHSDFNSWSVRKQFVLGEEITGTEKRRDADKIKCLITQEEILVNEKYKPTYAIRDCVNYLFTSNHPDAFIVDREDRRFAIWEISAMEQSREFYKEVDDWRRNGGAAHLLYYFQNEYKISESFDPHARPIMTNSKQDMMYLSLSDLDAWCEQLKLDPDSILKMDQTIIKRDLFTVAEIVNLYDPEKDKRANKVAMSKALRRAGFKVIEPTRTDSGVKRLVALRNCEKWARSVSFERARNYDLGRVKPRQKLYLKTVS